MGKTIIKRKLNVPTWLRKITSKSTLRLDNGAILNTTAVYILHPPHPVSAAATTTETQWITATVNGVFCHPLTTKPAHYNLPSDLNLSKLTPTTLAVSHNDYPPCDKLLVVPTQNPKFDDVPNYISGIYDDLDCTLLSLCNGGQFRGHTSKNKKRVVSRGFLAGLFDDIAIFMGKVYAVDRDGRLYLINISPKIRKVTAQYAVVHAVAFASGWRNRLVVDDGRLYLVVRLEEKLFKVYYPSTIDFGDWIQLDSFHRSKTLFMARDYYFFREVRIQSQFPGMEFNDCIVFSEGAFPRYGNDCWELPQFGDVTRSDDDIAVFRLKDGVFAREGENDVFPKIEWSPPAWVSQAWSDLAAESQSHSSSDSESEPEKDGGLDSNSSDADNEEMQSDVADQDTEQEKMETDSGTSVKHNTPQSIPIACATSATKSHGSDSVTTKFEGFNVRSDLVPTLLKIWQKHDKILENNIMRNGGIIARALESLATMVQILEENSAQSLSGLQADYLSSTLSDLRSMRFEVSWLIPCVEKAVKLNKNKHLLDSLNNLSQSSSQVKKRKAILSDELAKLNKEEIKLKKEMMKLSKTIPFSEQRKFDEPLGKGLT